MTRTPGPGREALGSGRPGELGAWSWVGWRSSGQGGPLAGLAHITRHDNRPMRWATLCGGQGGTEHLGRGRGHFAPCPSCRADLGALVDLEGGVSGLEADPYGRQLRRLVAAVPADCAVIL